MEETFVQPFTKQAMSASVVSIINALWFQLQITENSNEIFSLFIICFRMPMS